MRISDWSSDVCSSDLTFLVISSIDGKGAQELRLPILRVDEFQMAGAMRRLRRMEHHGRRKRVGDALFAKAPLADRRTQARAGAAGRQDPLAAAAARSAERREGKERVSPCKSRCSPTHSKQKKNNH